MTKKSTKATTTAEKVQPTKRDENSKGGSPLSAWFEGQPHDLVFAFNLGYGSDDPEENFWHFLLNIEGVWMCIKTQYSGYTHKGDLSQMAQAMLKEPDRALDFAVDTPSLLFPRNAKFMYLTPPRIS